VKQNGQMDDLVAWKHVQDGLFELAKQKWLETNDDKWARAAYRLFKMLEELDRMAEAA
jgi:hypothetical protein